MQQRSVLWSHTNWLIICGQNSAETSTLGTHWLGQYSTVTAQISGYMRTTVVPAVDLHRAANHAESLQAAFTTTAENQILVSDHPWPHRLDSLTVTLSSSSLQMHSTKSDISDIDCQLVACLRSQSQDLFAVVHDFVFAHPESFPSSCCILCNIK